MASVRCSFCKRSYRETGILAEGPETEGVRATICLECARLVVEILENAGVCCTLPMSPEKARLERIEACSLYVSHYEALASGRELTSEDLRCKGLIEAELERLRAE